MRTRSARLLAVDEASSSGVTRTLWTFADTAGLADFNPDQAPIPDRSLLIADG